jgi:hypothetical protein
LCDLAIAQNGCAIQFVPKPMQTVARGLTALMNNPDSAKMMTEQMKYNILVQNWENIRYFKPEDQTLDLLTVVVKCFFKVPVF